MNIQKIIDEAKQKAINFLKLAADLKLEDGSTITTNGVEFGEGVEVYLIDAEGNNVPLETKEEPYVLEDGTEFWVIDNKVSFTKPEPKVETTEEPVVADLQMGNAKLQNGTVVYWNGEFGMGTAIFLDEALTIPAPDGEHLLEDGTIVTTEGGLVVEIEVSSINEDVNEIETLKVQVESLKSELEQMAKLLSDNLTFTTELSKELRKKPAAEAPVKKPVNLGADTNELVSKLKEKIKNNK